jgi:hypothetical protein
MISDSGTDAAIPIADGALRRRAEFGGWSAVKFASIAWCAAIFATSTVGKSGSPAPKSMTGTPDRRSRSTIVVTACVLEPEMRRVRSASFAITI